MGGEKREAVGVKSRTIKKKLAKAKLNFYILLLAYVPESSRIKRKKKLA